MRAPHDRRGDAFGVAAEIAFFVVPGALGFVWRPLAVVAELVLFVTVPVAVWKHGPQVGIDRRAAVLVGIPLLDLFVIVPALWRWAHQPLPVSSGPLEPAWGRVAWTVMTPVGVACWLGVIAKVVTNFG